MPFTCTWAGIFRMGEPELEMMNTKPMTMILEMLFSPMGCVRLGRKLLYVWFHVIPVILNLWIATLLGLNDPFRKRCLRPENTCVYSMTTLYCDKTAANYSYEVGTKIILWFGVTTMWPTGLKSHSIRKIENYYFISLRVATVYELLRLIDFEATRTSQKFWKR